MTKDQDERLVAAAERIAAAFEAIAEAAERLSRPPIIMNPPPSTAPGEVTMVPLAQTPNPPIQAVAPHKLARKT